MNDVPLIFSLAILIMSVVVHEVAHGYAADGLGDPTPRAQGRLTLNPIPHLDMMGSLVLPGMLILFNAPFILGWAKPVVFNPMNFKERRFGPAWVAFAGPLSNLILAGVFGLLIRAITTWGILSPELIPLFLSIVVINCVLAVFNLIPIPPLDGHHILFAFLGNRARGFQETLANYSFIWLLILIFFLWQFLTPVISFLIRLFSGI